MTADIYLAATAKRGWSDVYGYNKVTVDAKWLFIVMGPRQMVGARAETGLGLGLTLTWD